MDGLLFLTHRIPYPPNKGDKIRSYNLLKYLAKHFQVYLGTFIDDPADRSNVEPLREYCREIMAIDLHPNRRKIASLRGLLNGKPLTVPYYANREMQDWISNIVASRGIRNALVFSSAMAQFIDVPACEKLKRIIDFVDVDSEKWRAYAHSKHWPVSRIYAREARKLLAYDTEIAARFDHSLFVSQAEADLFERLSGLGGEKIGALHNGVDMTYFDPDRRHENPYDSDRPVLVFTGAMDYWANGDAVCWFANEVFGAIRAAVPGAEFWIVGSRPSPAVQRLQRLEGVHVTGAVADVRPFLRHAKAAVAPLRLARGIQNKILEAMAMAKPVIATPQAIEGIDIGGDYESLITEKVPDMVDIGCAALISDRYNALGAVGRAYVERHHDWTSQLAKIKPLFTQGELRT